jgi:hypothetical protein
MATKKTKEIEALVEQALEILHAFGIPLEGLTTRRKEKMAKAFLAVAAVKPGVKWAEVKSEVNKHRLRSREVIRWMNDYLGEAIADSSYDDIRRKDLILPVEAGVVLKAAAQADAKTNDGTRAYAISPECAVVMRLYKTAGWDDALTKLMANRTSLIETLARKRGLTRIPLTIGDQTFSLSAGAHNVVQKAVVEHFLPLFGSGAEVLYLGDTEKKNLFHLDAELKKLGFFELAHDKLPDIVAYNKQKNWLFLIEAVDTSNPITELRKAKFEEVTAKCKADIVYVTAFADRATFRKFAKDIAWETEVWIADNPEHMIHFNGDKFFGPYKK